ncbi:17120_t:CDS:2 [Racocetra persica]|uniref:17120_t:CDS:1 n=1 Tax=Racocetra persica TaxID=160502 RepID=A0ACA9KK80_9GLOM|nr:17120_t:CDS:2 [Racocetra persica]
MSYYQKNMDSIRSIIYAFLDDKRKDDKPEDDEPKDDNLENDELGFLGISL